MIHAMAETRGEFPPDPHLEPGNTGVRKHKMRPLLDKSKEVFLCHFS